MRNRYLRRIFFQVELVSKLATWTASSLLASALTPPLYPSTSLFELKERAREASITTKMKTAFAASVLAMVGSTEAFVAPSAARAALATSNSLDTSRGSTTAMRATPSMEFAGGLRGADGPEPNSKNFDPLGFAEANPDNLLFFREAEIKVCCSTGIRKERACIFCCEIMQSWREEKPRAASIYLVPCDPHPKSRCTECKT